MTRKYTAFTKSFKLETLALANQPNTCIAQLARDLGLRRNMIYKWRIELKQNKQLAKDLKLAQMEVEILKKAQAFFKGQNS